MGKGISEAVARKMANAAVESGELAQTSDSNTLQGEIKVVAQTEAVSIAVAVTQARIRSADLRFKVTEAQPVRHRIYHKEYPEWISKAGLEDVELVEKFPVLTGVFGFTRDGATPGESQLQPFRRDRNYVIYGDMAETESLFMRLRPELTAKWLSMRGHALPVWDSPSSARAAILSLGRLPSRGEELPKADARSELLTLIHSYAHRVIRRISVLAGIDMNGLSEYLVPHHLGFFVFAAARGDFVLGGLQAVYESQLHQLLREIVAADSRCPLDPGCMRNGGACMACLHLGEPSCRYFNRYLSRDVLFGRFIPKECASAHPPLRRKLDGAAE
jgi:hypothetical protein